MIDIPKRQSAFAAVAALTAVLLIVPAMAQTGAPAAPATQGSGTPSGAAPAAPPAASAKPAPAEPAKSSSRAARLEAYIKNLHARLHITAAQEPQWQQVAQVMRDNAETVDKIVRERNSKLRRMTAVENLPTYAEIVQSHADGLKKLAPAFDNLYQAMSPAQKKNADAVFRNIAERHIRRPAPKPATPAEK